MSTTNTTFAPLNTIISWFAEDAQPSEQQFETTWKSFFHKSENIPVEQIYQLAEILNLKAERDHMHFDLAKKDGSNLSVEDINGLKEVLGVALAANGIINNIETTITSEDANALQDGIYKPKTTGVFTAIGLTAKENYTTLFKKLDGIWSVFSEEEMPMQDLTPLENQVLTYKYQGVHLTEFSKLVKNIYVDSKYKIDRVNYVGINDNTDRKFLIQLINEVGTPASFYISKNDKRNLKGQLIELVFKADNVDFRENTRVWIEFYDVEFPSMSELSFLESDKPIDLYSSAFSVKNYDTIIHTKDGVEENVVNRLYNHIEDIFIVDSQNRFNKNNTVIKTIKFNEYNERFFCVLVSLNGVDCYYYTLLPISKGAKNVKLEVNEGALKDVDIFVSFKDSIDFPTDSFTIVYIDLFLKLTNYAFKNFELNTKQILNNVELKVNSNIINVNKSNGNNAVQNTLNSITNASANNRYVINVASGLYEIHKKEDFLGNPGYPAMVCPKDHVDIKGSGNSSTILSADFRDSPNDDSYKYQTVYNWANDVTISDLTFVAKNLRYTLHQDNDAEANGIRRYKNVNFIFLGNGGSYRALGTGTFSGSKTYVDGGMSQSQINGVFALHNNVNFDKLALWSFRGHNFSLLDGNDLIYLQNCGSNTNDQLILENCSFTGGFILEYQEYWLYESNVNDHFNHANWQVLGFGNEPFYFKNSVKGKCLAIETISKNKDSKIRFKTDSSAYNVLIKNERKNFFGQLGNPNRKIQDEYIIQDGAKGISAFAFGGKSIIEGQYPAWGEQSNDSLGKRLGDCSTLNKILGIIINGTTYNIVFNKNYTDFTNAQIITEINAVIGVVATAKEYNIGADYYAELTDVVSIEVNNSITQIIPKGSLVSKIGSKIKICEDGEQLYGMAIDDIGAYELDSDGVIISKGRIIKNCYVSLDNNNISSVLYDTINGSKYKISNGRFVSDVNGQYRAIDNKYILI